MFIDLLFSSLIISAIALLWRIFSKEDFMASKIEKLPYLIRKPLTCGVCFSFWVSLVFTILFRPLSGKLPTLFANISERCVGTVEFLAGWMILGMVTVSIYYTFLTFWEGSHYLAHKAEELHSKNPKS